MSEKKLVRDGIIDMIKKDGNTPIYRILDQDEYIDEVIKKFSEELNEYDQAEDKKDRITQLCDILELVNALAMLDGASLSDIDIMRKAKELKRGSFYKRIYLDDVIENNEN